MPYFFHQLLCFIIVAKIRKWLPAEKIVLCEESDSDRSENNQSEDNQSLSQMNIEGLNIENAMKLLGREKLYGQILREYYLAIEEERKS